MNKDTTDKTRAKKKKFTSLSEVNLIHLVNDGNLDAREELLKRMIRRIQRKGGIVTKT
ncbi:MAG: hypothetical protein ABIJ37_04875 [Pseudomonadota bacterium]